MQKATSAAVFALYGLVFGLAPRSEAAVGAASGSLVILAFMGNMFFPLSRTFCRGGRNRTRARAIVADRVVALELPGAKAEKRDKHPRRA